MLLRVLLRLALLGFVLWTALVAFVCVKEYTAPKPDETTQAIIVLGAQVKPDGTLSLQLQYRMELALEQYRAHPQVIVVCGAQGGNEPMTEAQAMHDYLLTQGVPEEESLRGKCFFRLITRIFMLWKVRSRKITANFMKQKSLHVKNLIIRRLAR